MKSLSTLVLSLLCVSVLCQDQITIETGLGNITGIHDKVDGNDLYMFRKIPYAKSPVGHLRFEKPKSYGSWRGTLDATSFGPSCYQTVSLQQFLPNLNISEDCLHLNIYVPFNISINDKKSVMIWIHGGGYNMGQGMLYDGSNLAITGDVIVVTINYRLSVFGFFTTGDAAARGNYGLWDQMIAIKWVKDNIASFGGDGESITIFGQSGGGMSVGLLSIIPQNRGLFQRSIQQSGSVFYTTAISDNVLGFSKSVAKMLNCTMNDYKISVECLRNLTADELYQGSMNYFFNPIVDNELIPDKPINLLKNSESDSLSFFQSLDVIIGTCSSEGAYYIAVLNAFQAVYSVNVTEGIPKRILCEVLAPEIAMSFNNDTRITSAICSKYGQSTDADTLSMDIVNAFSDFNFHSPAVKTLRFHAKGKNKSKRFQYVFSKTAPFSFMGEMPPWYEGAGHGDELEFQFPFVPLSEDEKVLSTNLMHYWANFAKNGNVNGPGLVNWNEFTSSNESYIDFNLSISSGNHLYKDRMQFWLDEIPAIHQKMSDTSTASTITDPFKLLLLFFFVLRLF